jgi:O-antigen/teichoic acid export membrane protein
MHDRILRATVNYGIGRVAPQVATFVLIPVYTAYLTPADYGMVDLTMALVPVLTILMRLGLPGAAARYYYDYAEGPALGSYLSAVHRFIMANSLLVAGLAGAILWQWGHLLVPGLSFFPFVVLAIVTAFAAGSSELQRSLIQAREQSKYSATLSLAVGLTSLVLSLVLVVGFEWGALGVVLAGTITNLIFFLQARAYLRGDLAHAARTEHLWDSLKYAGGGLPNHLMIAGGALATRSVLAMSGSLAAVGVLGLGLRFVAPLSILTNAFKDAYVPVYFAVRKAGRATEHAQLVAAERSVWMTAVFGYVLVSVLGPGVVALMTPPQFHAAGSLLPILGLGFLAQVFQRLLGPEIYYSKKTYLVPVLGLSAGAVTVTITALTAERLGAHGAAWAMSAGLVVSAALAGVFSTRLGDVRHDWQGFIRVTIAGAACTWLGLAASAADFGWRTTAGVGAVLLFPLLLYLFGDITLGDVLRRVRGRSSTDVSNADDTSTPR